MTSRPSPAAPSPAAAARVLPFGDRGVLVECAGLDQALAIHARLARACPDGVIDLVPAARTVLVHVDPRRLPLAAVRSWIARTAVGPAPTREAGDAVRLPIVYDGPDLAALAETLGLTPAELAARHAACEWTVAFTGFAPGFGYLVSEDWTYDIPRLDSPRTRVPAGAVGLAAGFTGAYPRETPGGWQLIGTTTAPLFDADAAPPALLAPGTRVRFAPEAAPEAAPGAAASGTAPPVPAEPHAAGGERDPRRAPTAAFRVLHPGALTTVQDLGRPGHAAEGIAVSGAADRAALRRANRLVGNPEGAAALEVALGGFRAVAEEDLWFAVTGAWGGVRLDGRDVDPSTAHAWPRGAELALDAFTHGVRAVVAVRGGVAASVAVGSRATDTLSGLGPAALRPGDAVDLVDRHPAAPIPATDLHPWGPPPASAIDLEVAPGPRADWFAQPELLFEGVWTVSARADRVGVRLDGPPLARTDGRARQGELASEGMLPGAVQVPPDGCPVILGPDGPVTGGYPVVAVVTDATRDALAQARPGTRVRFRHAR